MKEIAFSRQAIKTLTRMPTNTRDLIRDKVSQLASDPASLANNTKRLQGSTNRYRLRVGDWRVIFDDAGNVLFLEQVVSRGGAYR